MHIQLLGYSIPIFIFLSMLVIILFTCMITVLYIVLVIVIACSVSLIFWTLKNKISPMPSSRAAGAAVLTAVKEIVNDPEVEPVIVEPGSGWGTLTVPIARRLPHCRVIGYENSPVPFLFSRLRGWIAGCNNLRITKQDFTKADLHGAGIIVCFLHPAGMNTVRTLLHTGTSASTVYVVSNTFRLHGYAPYKSYTVHDLYNSEVFVYRLLFA